MVILISGKKVFRVSPLFLVDSPLLNKFDQIMLLGPKVASSWGSYVLHRLISSSEPLPSLFKLAPKGQKMAHPGFHMYY